MRLINLFMIVNLVHGLIQKDSSSRAIGDPTKNSLMNIQYKNENFGLGVHMYYYYVITLASIATLEISQLKVVSLVDKEEYKIHDIMIHGNFSSSTYNKQYNIAVLKIDYRPSQRHIKLDPHNLASYADYRGTFSGWSWTDSRKPKQVYVNTEIAIKRPSECVNYFKSYFNSNVELCASNGEDNKLLNLATPGSSLFYHLADESVLLGLLSWSNEEDRDSSPVVFVRISAVNGWIRRAVKKMSSSEEYKKIFTKKSSVNDDLDEE